MIKKIRRYPLGSLLQHVVTVPAGDRDEGDRLRVVADLLDEVGGFLDDFIETVFGPLGEHSQHWLQYISDSQQTLAVSILLTATIS